MLIAYSSSEKTEFVVVSVPAQLNSLARIDSRQIGPDLIWRGSNWVKEYGLDQETIEQNELTCFMSPISR